MTRLTVAALQLAFGEDTAANRLRELQEEIAAEKGIRADFAIVTIPPTAMRIAG